MDIIFGSICFLNTWDGRISNVGERPFITLCFRSLVLFINGKHNYIAPYPRLYFLSNSSTHLFGLNLTFKFLLLYFLKCKLNVEIPIQCSSLLPFYIFLVLYPVLLSRIEQTPFLTDGLDILIVPSVLVLYVLLSIRHDLVHPIVFPCLKKRIYEILR